MAEKNSSHFDCPNDVFLIIELFKNNSIIIEKNWSWFNNLEKTENYFDFILWHA